MPTSYPLDLRTVIRTTKRRGQPASFAGGGERSGYAAFQPVGRDNPVAWDVAFRFTQAEAAAFYAWFVNDIGRGTLAFDMPIRTEFGVITHTCQFLPGGLLDCGENGGIWEYSATIMARELLTA